MNETAIKGNGELSKEIEGCLEGKGLRIGIVVSRFNNTVTSRLLEGAKDGLLRHQVRKEDITIAWVPGAFEIPLTAKKMSQTGLYHAIICLGAIIRGDTPHFKYISSEASRGIASVALESSVPVIFGVLTTDNLDQALERSGGKVGNKGYESAVGAIQMANLMRKIGEEQNP